MDNRHGNTGRRNAAKTQTVDSQITLRVASELKARCVAQAQREGMKLSPWIQKTLSEALGKQSKGSP